MKYMIFVQMNNLEYDKIKELVGMDERITQALCKYPLS